MSLHVHSDFSALDGWSTVDEIADRMVEIKCPFCGLTDHGVVSGHIDFDKAMRKRGLKPVFGAELYHGIDFSKNKGKSRDQAHLIALAMTDEGLRNLWRLTNATARPDKFHFVGRVNDEDILKYKEGIIFTSACPLGLVPQGLLKGDTTYLNWYLNNLGDNFRIEITTYPGDSDFSDSDSEEKVTPRIINEKLIEVANERGIPITYGDDGHYAKPEQFEAHDMYLALQTRQTVFTPIDERKMYHPPNAVCIKDLNMVRQNLSYLPESVVEEAISNTWEIGEKSNATLPKADRPHMPVFIPKNCPWTKEELSAKDLFLDLVDKGIEARYGGTEQESEAYAKAAYESEVLMKDGLEHYFLLAWDLVQYCNKNGIMIGPGRGSSAGCIVSFALGITDIDPLRYDLYFERFWNSGRADGFPDIDTDFPSNKREELRQYLTDRWGEENVCAIGTVGRLKPLETIDKLAKGFDISLEETDELKEIVKKTEDLAIHGVDQIGWNPDLEPGKVYYVKKDVGDKIEKWVGNNNKRDAFIKMCEKTHSRNSKYGIHPSGFVIADIPLEDYAPAYLRGGKDDDEKRPATQFPMKTIEALKLMKYDLLGLKTLDTLDEWKKLVAEKGFDFDWSQLELQEWPDEMWDMIDEGFVAGIFQVETKGGRKLTEELKPRSIEDLGVIVALNRPGPDEKEYVARKEGRRKVIFHHPILEPILKDTFGLFLYQEQIIRFMSDLGYSLSDADAVRKILGKKQPEKMNPIRDGVGEWLNKGFLDTAESKGFDRKTAVKVWEEIEEFASYSFNKSHAIAYAVLSFRCLLAKYHAPAEWYIACLKTVDRNKKADLAPEYIKEARRMGIKILPPDIRYSGPIISVHNGNINFGFSEIKGVASSGKYVALLRDENGFDISTPETFSTQLEELNDEELEKKKEALKEGHPFPRFWKSPKQLLNDKKIVCLVNAGAWDGLGQREISLRKKQEYEEELLGVILSDNSDEVIAKNKDLIAECSDFEEAARKWNAKTVEMHWEDQFGGEIPETKRFVEYTVCGIISKVHETKVRSNGQSMAIITIENGKDELTFAVFSKEWKTHKFMFKLRNVGIFTIRHTAPNEKRGEGTHFRQGYILH